MLGKALKIKLQCWRQPYRLKFDLKYTGSRPRFRTLLDRNIDISSPVNVHCLGGGNFCFVDNCVYPGGDIDSKSVEINRSLEIPFSMINSQNCSFWRCRYLHRTKIMLFLALFIHVSLNDSKSLSIGTSASSDLNSFSHMTRFPESDLVSRVSSWKIRSRQKRGRESTVTAGIWNQQGRM